MAGRHAQPLAVLQANGRKHLTKSEIETRKESEIKLGKNELDELNPPSFVENDIVAFQYWKQHLKEYKEAAKRGIELLTSSDVGTLALYCKTYSEYERLLKTRDKLEAISESNLPDEFDDLEDIAYNIKKIVNGIVSTDGILRLETAINKKMDMLIKMQDRLFLNPLAKIKNVPKKEKEKPKNPMEEEYDI
jgi:phage terminase small subunit